MTLFFGIFFYLSVLLSQSSRQSSGVKLNMEEFCGECSCVCIWCGSSPTIRSQYSTSFSGYFCFGGKIVGFMLSRLAAVFIKFLYFRDIVFPVAARNCYELLVMLGLYFLKESCSSKVCLCDLVSFSFFQRDEF